MCHWKRCRGRVGWAVRDDVRSIFGGFGAGGGGAGGKTSSGRPGPRSAPVPMTGPGGARLSTVTRPAGLLTAPLPRGGTHGRDMLPCLCVGRARSSVECVREGHPGHVGSGFGGGISSTSDEGRAALSIPFGKPQEVLVRVIPSPTCVSMRKDPHTPMHGGQDESTLCLRRRCIAGAL